MNDYARGGYVPGPGDHRTLVTLTPGEHVIRPDGTCARDDHHHDGPVIDMAAARASLERINRKTPRP